MKRLGTFAIGWLEIFSGCYKHLNSSYLAFMSLIMVISYFCGLGVVDHSLKAIGRAGSSSKTNGIKNISRNFHRRLAREKRVLPVKVTMVDLRVLVHRPKVREVNMKYPFIRLVDWAAYLLQNHSEHVLGGYHREDVAGYTSMLTTFWQNYYYQDPNHEVYSEFSDFSHVVPYCIHGDEGRGKAKSAILVTSFQPVIGVNGDDFTNMKG